LIYPLYSVILIAATYSGSLYEVDMDEIRRQGSRASKLTAALQKQITSLHSEKDTEYKIGFKAGVVYSMPNLSESIVRNTTKKMIAAGHVFEKTTEGYTINDIVAIYKFRDELIDFKKMNKGKSFVLFVNNLKGGVSKTVSVVTLSNAFKAAPQLIRYNLKTLVIDLDPQASSTMFLNYLHALDTDHSAVQAMLNDNLTAEQLKRDYILPTGIEGVDIIPASVNDGFIAEMLKELTEKNSSHKPYELLQKNVIDKLSDEYSIIIVDTGPHLNSLLKNALVSADMLATPVPPAMVDMLSTLKYLDNLPKIIDSLEHEGYPVKVQKNIGYMSKLKKLPEHTVSHSYAKKVFIDGMLNEILPYSNAYERVGESFSTIYSISPQDYNGTKGTLIDVRDKSSAWATDIFENHIKRQLIGDDEISL